MGKVIEMKCDNQTLIVLNSFEDFKKWYLRFFDLSLFAEGEINALLSEGKPDSYPCIPLVLDKNMSVVYFDAGSVQDWCNKLQSLEISSKYTI